MALIGSCVVIGVSQTTPHRSLEHTVTLQQERAAIEPPFLHARPAQRIPSVCASCRPGKLSMAADLERTNEIIAHATIELAGPIAQTTLAALTRRSDGLEHTFVLTVPIGLKVCYGAWTLHLNNTLGDYYWGRGRNNDQACSACCMVSPAIASPIPLTTGYIGQQQHDKRDFYFSCLSTGGVNWTQPDPVTEIFIWLSLSWPVYQ